jgi:hypothetical protein
MNELGRDSMELLDAARAGDDPLPQDKARIRQRLLQLGVGAAVSTAATAASTTAAASGLKASASIAPAAMKAAVTGAVVAGSGTAATTTVVSSVGVLALKFAVTVAVVGGMSAAGVKGVSVYRAHHATAIDTPAVVAVAPTPVAPPPVVAGVAAPPAPAVPPIALPAITAPDLPPPPAIPSEPPHAVKTTARTASPAVGVNPPPARAESTIEIETRLLRDAEALRRSGNGAGALALLDEHAARFPTGVLAEERAAGRVFALCDLGRVSDATFEAQRFLTERPHSALAARVRASCAHVSSP